MIDFDEIKPTRDVWDRIPVATQETAGFEFWRRGTAVGIGRKVHDVEIIIDRPLFAVFCQDDGFFVGRVWRFHVDTNPNRTLQIAPVTSHLFKWKFRQTANRR